MALGVGTRIGPYEVVAPLGKGGMGVVFRARDTRLQRDVALKLLPDDLAHDTDRLKRFEREAQLLASLNHPHIAQVYGLEPVGSPEAGTQAIAMELVDGETIAERVASRGPMPVDEVVAIARQIASALEAAHERGIVHRDLKPANIKLRPDGSVKVLDFGLAKELSAGGSREAMSLSPTVTGQTMPGVIMGTLGYMSPEQARGKAVDARADIWAFGCVLFEMLAGRAAFDGETATDILAAVVSGEPQWERLPRTTPAGLRQLLRVTLTRDVRERLQHIGDARLFLSADGLEAPSPATPAHRPERHKWIPIAIGAIVLLAALVPAALYFRRDAPDAPVMRFAMEAPAFAVQPNLRPITASPDGRWIASLTASDGPRLAVRAIDAQTWRTLPGTENAIAPFWSADGRFIGFAADGMLKKIDVVNGTVQALADGDNLGLGAWNRDNTIVFVRSLGRPVLSRISAAGGEIMDVKLDHGSDQIIAVFQPIFLPDGRHFLYHVVKAAAPTLIGVLYAASLDGGAPTQVMQIGDLNSAGGNSPVVFAAPGYLVFTRAGTLFAQKFDVDSLATTGEPVSIAQNVGAFDVSQTGVLIYSSAPPAPVTAQAAATQQLTWVTRAGKVERRVGMPGAYLNPRLSPDGRRIAVQSNLLTNSDILVLDADTGVSSRLTFDPAADGIPIWSPAGDRVMFASARGTPLPFPSVLYERAASGAGEDRQVMPLAVADLHIPNDWSPDGRHIVYGNVPLTRAQVGGDLWALPLDGDRKPFPLVQSKTSRAGAARFSPDGHWLAYTTNESGPSHVVVRPFPDVNKGTWQVPGSSGAEPKWRGREIFYLGPDQRQMMSVTVTADNDGITFSQPVALFSTGLPPQTNPPQFWFDVTADGQRFLLNLPLAATTATTQPTAPTSPALLNVVVNWTSLLTK